MQTLDDSIHKPRGWVRFQLMFLSSPHCPFPSSPSLSLCSILPPLLPTLPPLLLPPPCPPLSLLSPAV
eukprot:515945-Hanusia_phi.AAC.1